MDLIGVITAEPDPPGISKQRWIQLIGAHPNLRRGEPIEGINPFTRKPTTFRPAPDAASVVVDGSEVGMMCWSQDPEDNLLNVLGDVSIVGPIAHDVAKILGGRFDVSEESA